MRYHKSYYILENLMKTSKFCCFFKNWYIDIIASLISFLQKWHFDKCITQNDILRCRSQIKEINKNKSWENRLKWGFLIELWSVTINPSITYIEYRYLPNNFLLHKTTYIYYYLLLLPIPVVSCGWIHQGNGSNWSSAWIGWFSYCW